MPEFKDEEKKLQDELSWLVTSLKELAFEIEMGKYSSATINHKNLVQEIKDGVVIGYNEYGFELTIKVLY